MGSRSAFAPARLGRAPLRKGDVLAVGGAPVAAPPASAAEAAPPFANAWTLRVVPGPHGAPDLLTQAGLEELFGSPWTVHHQSDRTGVRLTGPAPSFARGDGGEAGLHPSNILDSAYGVGTLMLAGDMAVVVGPDGPSLGGFVAFGQVVREDLWMLGQVRAGDEMRLAPVAAPDRAPTPVLEGPREGAGGLVTYRRARGGGVPVEVGRPVPHPRSPVRGPSLPEGVPSAPPAP